MTKKEAYLAYLTKEGYNAEHDENAQYIIFKREGRTYALGTQEDDKHFFLLVFPNFWKIDDTDERLRVLKACDHTNATAKLAKLHTLGDNVWGTVEMLIPNPESISAVLPRSFSALESALNLFKKSMADSVESTHQ